jgi:hypothetical protein
VLLNVFSVFLINIRQFVARRALGMQQLVKLRVQCLGVSVIRSLYDQCHKPRRQERTAMPVERASVEDEQSTP